MASQFALLGKRRFLPFFIAQFLGAFNDNLFKTMLVVLVAYGVWDTGGWKPETLVSAAAGLFILPFVLVAPLGGSLADKYDKAAVMRWLKLAEIILVLCVILGLWLKSLAFLFFVLFAFGVHSALFSPSKYAIVPQQVQQNELIGANALMNTGTFIAILAGNVLGSLWGTAAHGHMLAFAVLMLCAVIGYVSSRFVPPAPAPDKNLKIRINLFSDIAHNARFVRAQHASVSLSLLAIGWFYFMGGTVISQFPNFVRQALRADHVVLGVFMAVFTIGIALGGLLNNKILNSAVSPRFVPLAALGIAVFMGDLSLAGFAHARPETGLYDWNQFIAAPGAYRVLFDLLMMAVCAGLFVVPLNAILQDRAADAQKARIMSVSNVLNALFMLGSSVIAVVMFSAGFEVGHLFLLTAALTLLVAACLWRARGVLGEVK